jgi:gamma-glutamylcysteine synthetase
LALKASLPSLKKKKKDQPLLDQVIQEVINPLKTSIKEVSSRFSLAAPAVDLAAKESAYQ